MSPQQASPGRPEPLSGWRWWTGLAAGGAIGVFGLAGLLRDAGKTMPVVWLGWLVGLLLVHDFLLAPLVNLAGRRLRRWTSEAWRWPLQLGLVTSGVMVLASIPVLYGIGRRTQPGNASVLPGRYPLALVLVLAVVWVGVLAFGAWRLARQHERTRSPGLHQAVLEDAHPEDDPPAH